MINSILVILIIILHFVFDWVLQPRHIAIKKGYSQEGLQAVFEHMLINILPFSFILAGILSFYNYNFNSILGICSINFISHFLIDLWLPKGNSDRVKINYTALDQILHITLLIILISTIK